MEVTFWGEGDELGPIAALLGMGEPDLALEVAGLPASVRGIGARDGRGWAAVGLLVEARLHEGRRNLAWLGAEPGARGVAGLRALLAELEAGAAALGVHTLGASSRPGTSLAPLLGPAGWRESDGMLQLRAGAPRPVPPLPPGHVERGLAEAGLDAWLAVGNESFRDVPFALPWTAAELERFASQPGFDAELVRVVFDGEGPVAFLRGQVDSRGEGEVEALGVLTRARRRGLGTWVLRRAAELLRARAEGAPTLWVAEANLRARALYEREGWTLVSRRAVWEKGVG